MRSPHAFHSLAERRSWALHRAVAELLAGRPELLDRARARVERWLQDPTSHPYAHAWSELLRLDLAEIRSALGSHSERMITLRQASPFAGALDQRTRWRILRQPDLTLREAR